MDELLMPGYEVSLKLTVSWLSENACRWKLTVLQTPYHKRCTEMAFLSYESVHDAGYVQDDGKYQGNIDNGKS